MVLLSDCSFACWQTHLCSGFLRLFKQEVSSSVSKSRDRKSKLPRTSSSPRVSAGEEHLNRERSFWGRAEENNTQRTCQHKGGCQTPEFPPRAPSGWSPCAAGCAPELGAPSQRRAGREAADAALISGPPAGGPGLCGGPRSPLGGRQKARLQQAE